MLRLVQNWFAKSACPIGVDLGTDSLRMAQVQLVDDEFRLSAAASADVPSHVRGNTGAKLQWFTEAARDLMSQGGFKGRQVVLGLPASMLLIQHLRMPKVDEETLKRTLPFEARGKLPVEPTTCLLRHIVAGEIFSEQEPACEVIVMAAAREYVNQFLDAAARAKLDVTGMNVEPRALIDCFANVYRRKSDREQTFCYVDIGASATRAVVACGEQVLFARSIPVGGDHFTRAAAAVLGVPFEEAKLLRVQAAANAGDERRDVRATPPPAPPAPPPPPAPTAPTDVPVDQSFALLNSTKVRTGEVPPPPAAPAPPAAAAPLAQRDPQAVKLEQACLEPLGRLIDELNLCRRYHEATFPHRPINRLVFVGGEARQRWLCQHVARHMQLAAQIGDPMVRMSRTTDVGVESGLDRRQPQPGWAVALGLTMGELRVTASAGASAELSTAAAVVSTNQRSSAAAAAGPTSAQGGGSGQQRGAA